MLEEKNIHAEDVGVSALKVWGLGIIALGLIGVWFYFAYYKENVPLASANFVMGVLAAFLGVVLLVALAKVQIRVRESGLYVRLFPFQVRFKRFAPEDLESVETQAFALDREFWGWGLKFNFKTGDRAITLSGDRGLRLFLKNEQQWFIGCREIEQIEYAVRQMMHRPNLGQGMDLD
jgi:hypothetical protein